MLQLGRREEPGANVPVASQMGDRTNLVMILAGELLKKAEYLLTMGLHPSEVVLGYELARDKALEELESESLRSDCWAAVLTQVVAELTQRTLETPLTTDSLILALRPTLASKQYGAEDLLAKLVAEAVLAVMPRDPKQFNVDNVRVVKIMGGGLSSSRVIRGMVFGREPEGERTRVATECIG